MIIGITGAICAGKRAFAEYLANKYGFELVNLLELFKIELHKLGLAVEVQSSPHKKRD
jgi:dephospho-CoA kinase